MGQKFITQCLPPTDEALALAARLIKQGELVAFPTETVYGLGGNALDERAIQKIFIAKNRPMDNPLIVHVAHPDAIEPLCQVNLLARTLIKAFWPGPLTLLLPKKPLVPPATTGGLKTVAVRMPDHPVALALIDQAGCPIAAPSANRSGRPSPTKAAHVLEDLQGEIPLILDGGTSNIGLESTVLDISQDPPQVLRPGGVTVEMLMPYCKNITVNQSVLAPLAADAPALSPGMRYKHYAPKGNLIMVEGEDDHVIACCINQYDKALQEGKKAAIFAFSEDIPFYGNRYTVNLGSKAAPGQAAAKLFDALREMDRQQVQVIFSEVLPPKGIGLAFMNRLGRAAAFQTIQADPHSL